jgi:hypothetical protein
MQAKGIVSLYHRHIRPSTVGMPPYLLHTYLLITEKTCLARYYIKLFVTPLSIGIYGNGLPSYEFSFLPKPGCLLIRIGLNKGSRQP